MNYLAVSIHTEDFNIIILFFGSSLWWKEKKDPLNRQIIDWKSFKLNEKPLVWLFFLKKSTQGRFLAKCITKSVKLHQESLDNSPTAFWRHLGHSGLAVFTSVKLHPTGSTLRSAEHQQTTPEGRSAVFQNPRVIATL